MKDNYNDKWLNYLHNMRQRSIDMIFKKYGKQYFNSALEIGAGDGFQSQLLQNYTKHLTATDFSSHILNISSSNQIEYNVCDAECVASIFAENSFDLVYSSNLLEHIFNIDKCILGIHKVLNNSGISIHCMPSVFLKWCNVLFYYPHLLRLLFRAFVQNNGFAILKQKYKNEAGILQQNNYIENNPKSKQQLSNIIMFLWPQVHGISSSNFNEFLAFKKSSWKTKFNKNGFDVVDVLKGPVYSGYGFNFNFMRIVFEKLGFTSENIFICRKKQ